MWQEALSSFFGDQELQSFRDSLHDRERNEPLRSELESFIDFLGDGELTVLSVFEKIIKYTLNSKAYPACFNYGFFPVGQRDYYCSCCLKSFGKHLQMFPCRHKVCEDCVESHIIHDFRCPNCEVVLTDVYLDFEAIQRQITEHVYCIHHETTREAYYAVCKLTYERYFDPALEPLVEHFNQNKISFHYLNQMRNCWLLEDPSLIQDVVSGENQLIETILPENTLIEYVLPPCEDIMIYRDIEQHLDGQCSHCMIECPYEGCEELCSRKLMCLHEEMCQYRPLNCSICYERVNLLQFNNHVRECVNNLAAVCAAPLKQVDDIELRMKIGSVESATRCLTQKIEMWDNVVQKEVIDALTEYRAPEERHIVSERVDRALQFLYKKYIFMVNFVTEIATLGVLDYVQQEFPLQRPYWAIGLCAFQFVNLALFLFYVASFIYSNQYRSDLAGYMFSAYYVGIIDCGMIYTLLQFTDNKSISIHRSSVGNTFFDLLYYASVVGSSIGFGDVVSGTPFVRIVTIIEIYYTQLICKMVFRGLSFYIKERDLEENRI